VGNHEGGLYRPWAERNFWLPQKLRPLSHLSSGSDGLCLSQRLGGSAVKTARVRRPTAMHHLPLRQPELPAFLGRQLAKEAASVSMVNQLFGGLPHAPDLCRRVLLAAPAQANYHRNPCNVYPSAAMLSHRFP
jgi:hypothetical protein